MTYLTPSFYSSAKYWREIESKPREDLINLLEHKPIETTPIMQAGIKFEDEVHALTGNPMLSSTLPGADKVADIVRGSVWQLPIVTEVKDGNDRIKIVGRCDCVRRDWIYDIKYSKSYSLGKYYNSIQHLSYMQALNLKKFRYIVCSWSGDVFEEEYFMDHTNKDLLKTRVFELIEWLRGLQLYDIYAAHWQYKGE